MLQICKNINIFPAKDENNHESNQQSNEKAALDIELQKLKNMSSESETCENSSEDDSIGFESVNSGITFITPQSIKKDIMNNQLIVLEPNNPVMVRFQNTLKQHLLKQKDSIKQELLELVSLLNYKFYLKIITIIYIIDYI